MSLAMTFTNPGIANRPKVVCLCGSARFANEFMRASFQETVSGNIVLSVGGFSVNTDGNWQQLIVTAEQKLQLDKLHLQKIDIADEVLVINVGGYIGESTLNEIKHALKTNKIIRFMEPTIAPGNLSAADYQLLNSLLSSIWPAKTLRNQPYSEFQPGLLHTTNPQETEINRHRISIYAEIEAERLKQDAQWGGPDGDDNNRSADWLRFINKQLNHAYTASQAECRGRLIKIAALATAAVESMDRKLAKQVTAR